MALLGGKASMTLFKEQSEVERQFQLLSTDKLLEKLGLSKPDKKRTVGNYDLPLIPTVEDYALFPFRQLSETIVGVDSWKATDFSVEGVLKRSTKLLEGKPAYLNHVQEVGKEIGTIGETDYQAGYKLGKYDVPPGIVAPFMIDGKLHPDLVRKMSGPQSAITSCSVSVFFEWEASHEFERPDDFYWHLGEKVENKIVCRRVIKILDYGESSLVWLGADAFAKMLDDDGKIINIDKAALYSMNKFSTIAEINQYSSGRRFYTFDCLDSEKFLHLSASSKNPEPKTSSSMLPEEVIAFLAVGLGLTAEDVKANKFDKMKIGTFKIVKSEDFAKMKPEADFTQLVTDKAKAETDLAAATTAKTKAETELATLKAETETSKGMVTLGKKILEDNRTEALRVYGIFSKGKPEKAIEDRIKAEVDLEKIGAEIRTFGGKAVHEFGGHCSKCGSKDIQFRTSENKDDPTHRDEQDEDNALETAAYAD